MDNSHKMGMVFFVCLYHKIFTGFDCMSNIAGFLIRNKKCFRLASIYKC